MIYQNCSFTTKTYYGVEFKPGEAHEVPSAISDPRFIQLQSLPETVSDEPSIEPETEVVSDTDAEPKVDGRRKSKKIIKEEITDGSDNN